VGFIDRFIASATFNVTKVALFRRQNVWKSMIYLMGFVLIMGAVGIFWGWEASFLQFRELWAYSGLEVVDTRSLMFSHFMVQYIMVALDLLTHLVIVSAIAFAGARGYRKMRDITFKESWNVTAHGITAPILVRTVVNGLGINLPVLIFVYWGAVMLFCMLALRGIVNLPVDE